MTLRTGWLREHSPWIRGMLHEGYSPWKISKTAKRQGWGIRHTDAMETVSFYINKKSDAVKAWKSTPLKYKPSDLKIPRFTGITAKRYLAEIVVIRQHKITGITEEKTFRLGFEDLITRGNLEAKAREIGEKAGVTDSDPLFNVTSIKKVEIFKSQFA